MTEPVTAPTPLETVRQRLTDAPAPLGLKELTKGLKKPAGQKADAFAQSLAASLSEDVQAGRSFKYPSGPKGADRFWVRDEKDAIREAVLAAASTPTKLSALKKVAKESLKADKAFADALVDEMVAAKHLHEHPGKGTPYGREKHVSPNDREKVSAAILAGAAVPAKLADLIADAQRATGADKTFVAAVAAELVQGEQLYKHGSGRAALYGREKLKPPHPLDVGAAKTAFGKLTAAARKLLQSVQDVTPEDLLGRLRAALANEPPEAEAPPGGATVATKAAPEPTFEHPKPESVTPDQIRAGLKAAYDDLCLEPEFEDKLVEIRRLYHEAARALPGMTVEQFHRELEHLQSHRTAELQPLNEVQRAKEPELAIRHGDRLLYFVRWR